MAGKSERREAKRQRLADRLQRQTPAKTHWLNDKTAFILVGSIFLVHSLGLVSLFFPLAGLVNNQPITAQDWGLHFHHLKSMEAFWNQDRAFWGYNPFFMAGYPSNTIQDLSIKIFEFSALLLSSLVLTPLQWFKLLAFLSAAAVPWLMYFAARNFFAQLEPNIIAPVAALLGAAYWWNSLPREMFFYGMVGFPAASYLTVLGVSIFYRMAALPGAWSPAHLAWVLFALAIPALHVQSALIFLPPALALLIYRPKLCSGKLLLWCAGAAVLSLLANWVWLAPAVSHLGDDVSASIVEQLPLFVSSDPLTLLRDYLEGKNYWSFRPLFWEKGLRLALLALGSLGVWRLIRGPRTDVGVMLLGALTALFIFSYLGSLVPLLRSWQPLRFKVPFDLFLVPPAAYIISRWLTERWPAAPSYIVPIASIVGGVAFLANVITTELDGRMLLRTQMRPEIRAVAQWIQNETPADARVLFEESGDETGFVYDGMYLSSFIPRLTGRELIGGPINLYNDRHHFAEFHSAKLFKKEIHRLSDEEIRNYFRLYNIGAVVAFHPASVQRLQALAGLITVDRRIGPVHLMKVNQPLTWFLQGAGKARAKLNRIEVTDAAGGEIILKYHWAEGLAAAPAARVVPITLLDDPIPFIKIMNPPREFILSIEN